MGQAKTKVLSRAVALSVACALLVGCTSPRGRVASELRDLGVPRSPSKCIARAMDDRLDKGDMKATARFLRDIDRQTSGRRSNVLQSLESIDNPKIAKAAGRATLACTVIR